MHGATETDSLVQSKYHGFSTIFFLCSKLEFKYTIIRNTTTKLATVAMDSFNEEEVFGSIYNYMFTWSVVVFAIRLTLSAVCRMKSLLELLNFERKQGAIGISLD